MADLPEVPFVQVSYNPAEGLTLAGPAADDAAPGSTDPHITTLLRYDPINDVEE